MGIISYEPNVLMLKEICIWILCFFVISKTIKKTGYFRTAIGVLFIFTAYIHRIILPFIVSGAYLFFISGIIAVFAGLRLSAFMRPFKQLKDSLCYYTDRENRSSMELFLFFTFLAVVMIQLSRINIAMDYDSLRYGLRSEYVLTGGNGLKGFFENAGFVNMVYSYPKGYELLTLPLNFGHTYGYVLCVNIWMLMFVCIVTARLAAELIGSREAELAALSITALIPGISNMAVTAKTDLITVLLQLVFIYSVIRFLKTDSNEYVGIGLCAIILSYTMKPTAYIFSTIIGLMALCFLIRNRKMLSIGGEGIRLVVMALMFFGIIMLRTFMLSGLPVAGVFTEAFEQLGFELKYPMASVGMPQGKAEGFLENLINMLTRLVLFVFFPAGEDMGHVRMAWGGLVFAAALIAVFCIGRRKLRILWKNIQYRYLFESFYLIALLSLITLFLLYQVDGNYYMLLYVLTAVTSVSAFYGIRESGRKRPVLRVFYTAISAFMCFVTAMSGWAGAVGFTPVDLKNRGYYNHEIEYGWKNPLALDASSRVIAFAGEPDCYRIRAGVESFVDIDGSGGNVLLTDTKLNIFKEYCSFADIDYIYVDRDWLNDETNQRHVRAKVLFTYMLEDGDFSEIFVTAPDGSEIYFKVDKERMAVPWETEMSEELEERIREQSIIFKELIG